MTASNTTSISWNRRTARHLLQRAGFGLPVGADQRLADLGLDAAVAAIVDYQSQPDDFEEPDWLTTPLEFDERRDQFTGTDRQARQMMINDIRREQRQQIARLKVWWMRRMRETRRPLEEKMALFWHGHFAVSAEKVRQPLFHYQLNSVFRRHATSNFKDLVFEVGKSPAMMLYLDNQRNLRGRPNENWARELLELFTIGIGNYTERDIKEAARAFSGYSVNILTGDFVFNWSQHDSGEKTFLGVTGNLDGADVIDIIFNQPETSRFITRKLWEYFAWENPDAELVERLSGVFRQNDYELKPLLRAIFTSPEFYSPQALAGQIKSPVQFLVMLSAQVDLPQTDDYLTGLLLRNLGQDLFYPPNVRGWIGNRDWINANTLLMRQNIAGYLVAGTSLDARPEEPLDLMAGDRPAGPPVSQLQRRLTREMASIMRERMQSLQGRTAPQIVDYLMDRCLSEPLDAQRRALLIEVLADGAPPNALLDLRHLTRNVPATMHLLFSTAEYQLC